MRRNNRVAFWSVVALTFVLCSPLWAQDAAQPADPAEPVDVTAYLPDPSEVEAFDRPSDDGTAILITWPVPDETPEGLTFVVEIAPASEGFADSTERTPNDEEDRIAIEPGSDSRCDENPKYFTFSKDNEGFCFAEVVPAEVFKAPTVPERVAEHAAEALDAETVARIKAILETKTPPGEFSDDQRADLDLAIDATMAWRLSKGALTKDEAERAAHASRLTADFERKVFLETQQAKADKELVELAEKEAIAASLAADIAFEEAKDAPGVSQEELAELAQALEASKDAERLAKADTRAANRRVKWMPEEVRSSYSDQDQSDMDWLTHLTAYLDRQDKKVAKKADRATNAEAYVARVGVLNGDTVDFGPGNVATAAATAVPNLFKHYKLNNLIFALTFSTIILVFIQVARRNPNLFVRKIAGLDAIEEAIGRCTEMGRSAYFVHGYGGTGSMPTIAALNILSRVARRAADYDTRVKVTNLDPIVTAVSQEVVQQAYMEAGRPDAFDPDDVFYLTSEQFAYAAAVSGRLVREKPAAVFLIGYFMAESLLLAETGASTGAIQVAGTDAEHQLPFFITTCDYTLIGEELYAASAYLSREPRMLGSLRGQDVGKAFMMIAIIISVIILTIAAVRGWDVQWITNLFEAIS